MFFSFTFPFQIFCNQSGGMNVTMGSLNNKYGKITFENNHIKSLAQNYSKARHKTHHLQYIIMSRTILLMNIAVKQNFQQNTSPLNNFHVVRVLQPYFPARFYEVRVYLNMTWLDYIADPLAFRHYRHIPKQRNITFMR